jgi:hypothetical protein
MISYLAGYVLPLPRAVMAWFGWFRIRKVPPRKAWRRLDSLVSLAVLTASGVLWLFYVIRLGQGTDLFETTATNVATLGTALLIVPSALAGARYHPSRLLLRVEHGRNRDLTLRRRISLPPRVF